MKIGSLFYGYGGLERGVQEVLGGTVAWHSEIDPGACKILAHRYPDVPNLGDITAVDWAAVEPVDVLTGGFPCQDVSCAGLRKGLRPDTRSGLWTQFAYAIDQLRPTLVVAENVRGLLSAEAHSDLEPCPWCVGDGGGVPLRALGAVLGDLADIGYDASWHGLRAADVGAPHGRFRVFVVAWNARDPYGLARPALLAQRRGSGPVDESRAVERTLRSDRAPTAADPECLRSERRRGHGDLAGAQGAGEVDGGERQWDGDAADDRGPVAWGQYEFAIRRWEVVLGRQAPAPTEIGAKGQPRLSPRFVEWLMGLPVGWVTDVPGLSRNEQLKALGNGVVPQQAAAALRLLLPDVVERAA